MVSAKDLDAQLRALRAKAQDEERDWVEQGCKLYEFEEKFLRDTLLEGNVLTGWGSRARRPCGSGTLACASARGSGRRRRRSAREARGAVDAHAIGRGAAQGGPPPPGVLFVGAVARGAAARDAGRARTEAGGGQEQEAQEAAASSSYSHNHSHGCCQVGGGEDSRELLTT